MRKYTHVKCQETCMVCSLTLWLNSTPKPCRCSAYPWRVSTDIIILIVGCVPKSSTSPWNHLSNYKPEHWQITGQEHFPHQLNKRVCLAPCHKHVETRKQLWDLKMLRNIGSLIKWLNHLPLGCISDSVYFQPKFWPQTSLLPVGFLHTAHVRTPEITAASISWMIQRGLRYQSSFQKLSLKNSSDH